MAGSEGPVVFCLHGGGYSGLVFFDIFSILNLLKIEFLVALVFSDLYFVVVLVCFVVECLYVYETRDSYTM